MSVVSHVPVVRIQGVPFDYLTEVACARHVVDEAVSSRGGWVLTINTDILRRYRRDVEFRTLTQPATLIVADGMPIVWASRLQGEPLPERIAGSSLLWSVSERAATDGAKVFLLGGNPGMAEAARAALCKRYVDLDVVGTYCPNYGFMDRPAEVEAMRAAVIAARPDIVFVALGCPLQEQVIGLMLTEIPHVWWLGVGISFSLAAGDVDRAPLWMQLLSLEWLHRLVQEPGRLAKRYLVDDLPYALALLAESFVSRLRRGRQGS